MINPDDERWTYWDDLEASDPGIEEEQDDETHIVRGEE